MATLKQRKFMIKVAIFARGPTNLKGINMSVNSIIIILYHRYSFPLVSAYTHPPTHSLTKAPAQEPALRAYISGYDGGFITGL